MSNYRDSLIRDMKEYVNKLNNLAWSMETVIEILGNQEDGAVYENERESLLLRAKNYGIVYKEVK